MLSSNRQVKSFLQSPYWAEFQRLLGREVYHLDGDCIQARAYEMPMRFGLQQIYVPYGPDLDNHDLGKCGRDPMRNFIEWLEKSAREVGAFVAVVEPRSDYIGQLLIGHGFEHRRRSIQPSKTVVLDLQPSLSDIESGFHQKLRYNIRIAKKHGINIVESDDIEPFLKLLKETTERDNFSAHDTDYYRQMCKMFLGHAIMPVKIIYAMNGDKYCASALVLEYEDTGYYLHGASSYEFRSMMAPQLMHWEIIQDLKGRDFKKYDLWGIDAIKYPGVTRFKLQFGGSVIEYPGAYVLPVNKLLYWLYSKIR